MLTYRAYQELGTDDTDQHARCRTRRPAAAAWWGIEDGERIWLTPSALPGISPKGEIDLALSPLNRWAGGCRSPLPLGESPAGPGRSSTRGTPAWPPPLTGRSLRRHGHHPGPAGPLAGQSCPVVLCISLGALLLMLRDLPRLHAAWIAIAGLAVSACFSTPLSCGRSSRHGPLTMVMGRWLPPFGIAFTVDLFGALMALAAALAALVGGHLCAVAISTESGRRYGFFPLLMLLMAGVTGAFLTGDIFNLYVWFEVLLISSFGLLILGSERGADRRRAEICGAEPHRHDAVPHRCRLSSMRASARSTWPISPSKAAAA